MPGLPCSVSAVGVPIISCMGAGNKVDTTAFEVADIYETSVCPLARVMRRELKKRGIKHLKVVYSKEPAMTLMDDLSISCRPTASARRIRRGNAPSGGRPPAEIIYISGAGESNNLAVKGVVQASRHTDRHIISTALEHASVDIERDDTVDLEQPRDLLRKNTVLVSVCAVDSELGTVQPVREIAEILKEFPNCRLHVDATQAVGKTDLVTDGADTMSIAPTNSMG